MFTMKDQGSAVPKGRWGTWTHVYIADVLASFCIQQTAVSIYQVKVSFESRWDIVKNRIENIYPSLALCYG